MLDILDLGRRGIILSVLRKKGLNSCAITAQLIGGFVFGYAKIRFSHDAAHIITYSVINFLFHKIIRWLLALTLNNTVID